MQSLTFRSAAALHVNSIGRNIARKEKERHTDGESGVGPHLATRPDLITAVSRPSPYYQRFHYFASGPGAGEDASMCFNVCVCGARRPCGAGY